MWTASLRGDHLVVLTSTLRSAGKMIDGQYIIQIVFSTGRIESYYSHPLDPLHHPLSQYSLAQVSYRVLGSEARGRAARRVGGGGAAASRGGAAAGDRRIPEAAVALPSGCRGESVDR